MPLKKNKKKTNKTTAIAKRPDDTLRLPPGARVTPVSLEMPDDFDMNLWKKAGTTIKMLAKGAQWWVGDWLNFGEARFGEKYSQYIDELGLAQGTIANYQSISGRMPPDRRKEELSFGHHESVLAVEDPKLQDELLEMAIKENWTREQLRNYIRDLTKKVDTGPVSKRKIDVKMEYEDEPAEDAVEQLKRSIQKVVESGKMGCTGKVTTFSWHK